MTDQISKVIDIVLAQSNDLWPISTGLLLVAFGMLASSATTTGDKRPGGAMFLLLLTIALCILSLFFGYVVKGSLIKDIASLTKPEDWTLDKVKKWSAYQGACTVLSAAAFGSLLYIYPNFSFEALARYMGK
jgi:hypothetical protein